MRCKLLIIIALLSVFSPLRGQMDDALLEKIDFNDTTLVDSDFFEKKLAEYIDSAQNPQLSAKNQMYNYILATDNILSKCTSFEMYSFVYQYLISGFSELGANMVVDYLRRMPHLEYTDADSDQINYIIGVAERYNRVKIGYQAPDIQCVTVDGKDFSLSNVKSRFTIVLFWSYNCPHCRDLIKELADFTAKNKDFTVVTFNVFGELKPVKRFLKKSGLAKAYNICDGKGWDSQVVEDYAVDMTPSMFLLDENKLILSKPFDIDDILNSVEL